MIENQLVFYTPENTEFKPIEISDLSEYTSLEGNKAETLASLETTFCSLIDC